MKLTKNIIALQKGFVLGEESKSQNKTIVASLQAHLMQFGYMLDQNAFDHLSDVNIDDLKNLNNELISYLKETLGGKYNYQSLYKNFPEEVMSKSDFELFFNAILHYWSNGTWEPSTTKYEKPITFENIKYNIITFTNEERFNKIFTDLISINQSLTPNDQEIVKWFISNNNKLVFPKQISFKENLSIILGSLYENNKINEFTCKLTTTDVLRFCVHLSGGDVSLPKVPNKMVRLNRWSSDKSINPERENFKFKKFSRPERRFILGLLEKTNCDVKEMVLKDQRWIRLGEILHPTEYAKQFPKTAEAFRLIRNTKVRSWYSELNENFKLSLESGLRLLIGSPGEFARRLDWLIRTYPEDVDTIMLFFTRSVAYTSNKVLFEMYDHFKKRSDPNKSRSVMVKGSRKRTELPILEPLDKNIIDKIQTKITEALKEKFSILSFLGNCFIDEKLKLIPLPTNMRSMNFSIKPIIRGQRVPLDNPDAKIIRPFVHWMDIHGTEDLDLSVTFVADKKCDVLSYSNLRVDKSIHSGDVRHRKGPCAEYVDIDMNDAIEKGYKFAVIDVRNYDGDTLKSVESVFGMMEREFPESNNIWLPETITNCQTLESSSTNTIIGIIDLITKEYIMLDIDSDGVSYASGDVKNVLKIIEEYSSLPKFSVYDLVKLHVDVRGKHSNCIDSETIHTYFKYEDFCNSYEKTGQLMGI